MAERQLLECSASDRICLLQIYDGNESQHDWAIARSAEQKGDDAETLHAMEEVKVLLHYTENDHAG